MKGFVTAGIVGAALVYFLDPRSGSKRRSSVSNKASGLMGSGAAQTVTSKAQNMGSQVAQQAQNLGSQVQGATSTQHDNDNPDDKTLTDRVESIIFKDTETGRENININVVDGVVEVRGEQPNQEAINELIDRIKSVRGVKSVQSYLHLPGTVAPNKAAAINAS